MREPPCGNISLPRLEKVEKFCIYDEKILEISHLNQVFLLKLNHFGSVALLKK